MAKEIERKFLVDPTQWDQLAKSEGTYYRQGYLLNDPGRTVRIRIAGDRGYLTIKGPTEGFSRLEYEYPIPAEDVAEMMEHFKPEGTEKVRYKIPAGNGLTWEVDVFTGHNQGLIIAEIELGTEDQEFDLPDWIGAEVTGDERYYNAVLALKSIPK